VPLDDLSCVRTLDVAVAESTVTVWIRLFPLPAAVVILNTWLPLPVCDMKILGGMGGDLGMRFLVPSKMRLPFESTFHPYVMEP